jgi:thiol-disulfide isomerase/thioredoxin
VVAAALLWATVAHAARIGAGDRAPEFTLPDWQGRPTALAARRGRVVVVDFWATWCTTCRTALPGLDALARRHPKVDVMAVNIDENRAAADTFLTERLPAPAMTMLHDPGGELLARFGANGMPALYVIDREGVVRLAEAGYAVDRLGEIERTVERFVGEAPGKAP